MQYEVIPHVGVPPVLIGMSREESRAAMAAEPDTFERAGDPIETDAYRGSALQVSFGPDDRVEFIELARDEAHRVLYRGTDVFATPADELVAIIARDAPYDPDDPELGYTYTFPELNLTPWRPTMPEGGDDLDGRYFESIGVGRQGYVTEP